MILVTAPIIWVHMESVVSPVDCKSLSAHISRYTNVEPMVTIFR